MMKLKETLFLAIVVSCGELSLGFSLGFPGMNSPFAESDPFASGRKLVFNDIHPSGVTRARAGEGLELQCEAVGSPSPTIHWLYRGSRIMQRDSGDNSVLNDEPYYEETAHNEDMDVLQFGSTNSRLFIDCVTPADAGEFTCVADTPFKRISTTTIVEVDGGEDSASACAMGHLKGGFPARITMWSAHRLELEGGDVQLYCRAEGRPAPTITWFDRMGNAITGTEPGYEVLGNGDLLIRDVTWMNHMGLYKCRAENSKGSDEQAAFLYPTSP